MANFINSCDESRSLCKELEEEILSRLPVKSLARFRCVCKSWLHLICDEKFISTHIKNSNTSYLLVGVCSLRIFNIYSLPLQPGAAISGGGTLQKVETRELPPVLQESHYRTINGVCNGIILMRLHNWQADIALWNPATKDFKVIPESNMPKPYDGSTCALGLGFDPKRNDYKVVRMVHTDDPVSHLDLFSLRMNSWKKISFNEYVVDPWLLQLRVCNLPCAENRVVCVLGTRKNNSSGWGLMLFDVCSETFEIIPVSPSIAHYRKSHMINMFSFEKSIAVGVSYFWGGCDIWILDDFCSTKSVSWTKLLSIEPHLLWFRRHFKIVSWGSLILVRDGQIVRLFDCSKHAMLDVRLNPPLDSYVSACVFKESLVRITEIEEKGQQV